MLYSCTHMATVGVKGLSFLANCRQTQRNLCWDVLKINYVTHSSQNAWRRGRSLCVIIIYSLNVVLNTEKTGAGPEQRCPIRGRRTIFTGTANCESHFRSSCSSPFVVDIVSTCSSRPGSTQTITYSLLWYTISRRAKNSKIIGYGRWPNMSRAVNKYFVCS